MMLPPARKVPSRVQGSGDQTLTPGPKAIKSKYHRNPSKNSVNIEDDRGEKPDSP